jgi:hypothetical protein
VEIQHAYAILGVTADTPLADVKKKYRARARMIHPDTVSDPSLRAEAEQAMTELSQAWATIQGNPEQPQHSDVPPSDQSFDREWSEENAPREDDVFVEPSWLNLMTNNFVVFLFVWVPLTIYGGLTIYFILDVVFEDGSKVNLGTAMLIAAIWASPAISIFFLGSSRFALLVSFVPASLGALLPSFMLGVLAGGLIAGVLALLIPPLGEWAETNSNAWPVSLWLGVLVFQCFFLNLWRRFVLSDRAESGLEPTV